MVNPWGLFNSPPWPATAATTGKLSKQTKENKHRIIHLAVIATTPCSVHRQSQAVSVLLATAHRVYTSWLRPISSIVSLRLRKHERTKPRKTARSLAIYPQFRHFGLSSGCCWLARQCPRGCHCWLVQQCVSGSFAYALLGKPAVAPFFNGLLAKSGTPSHVPSCRKRR